MSDSFGQRSSQFGRILDFGLEHTPDKTAITCYEASITYSQLDSKANRVANAVSRYVKPHEHVGIMSVNCIEYFEIAIGCARAGAVLVNINWRLSPRELMNLLKFNDCRLAFIQIENDLWEKDLKQLLGGSIPLIEIKNKNNRPSDYDCMIGGESSEFKEIPLEPDDILMHIHTSGTTGIPKCVMHSHESFINEMHCCREIMKFSQHEVYQTISQMFHVACIGPYMELAAGGTVVLFKRFDPDEYLKSVEKNHVNRLSVIPTVLNALLKQIKEKQYNLNSVNIISYSTCPIPLTVLHEAINAFPECEFIQSYGMTEMGSVVTVLSGEDHKNPLYLQSVGKCIPGCEIKIIDENGKEQVRGLAGEICIKGSSLLKGYYKRPELYGKYIVDGWLHSGDLGYVDEAGYLFLEGRKNDMIISGGENVYPKEIEDRIMELTDDVLEAAVFGIKDENWGEVPYACVVLAENSCLTSEKIIAYLREHLAHYKIPKQIEIVAELPKNNVGKVIKSQLRKKYSDEL